MSVWLLACTHAHTRTHAFALNGLASGRLSASVYGIGRLGFFLAF